MEHLSGVENASLLSVSLLIASTSASGPKDSLAVSKRHTDICLACVSAQRWSIHALENEFPHAKCEREKSPNQMSGTSSMCSAMGVKATIKSENSLVLLTRLRLTPNPSSSLFQIMQFGFVRAE